METAIYNIEGLEEGKINLPENIFGVPWNEDLVHQIVVSMQANARQPIAHAKDRGEVSGGGKKPWKQKGTGRARHGSIRSPIWVGGGVAHGPRNEKVFIRKINKKMKTKALFSTLSRKLHDGEVLFVNDWTFAKPSTKEAVNSLSHFSKIKGFETLKPGGHKVLFVTPEKSENFEKSLRNIGNIDFAETRNLNSPQVLASRYLVFIDPENTLKVLALKIGTEKKKKAADVAANKPKTKKKTVVKKIGKTSGKKK
jgi:large subunit ribosomal protein L4